MNWTAFPDKIFLINLPERKDRLRHATQELRRYHIPFERFEAVKDEDQPREGLKQTLTNLFTLCCAKQYERVLVLEDDVKFIADPNRFMPLCIEQLQQTEWDLFYLGINPSQPFVKRHSPNLFLLKEGWSTHAVMYTLESMLKVLSFEPHERPIDVLLAWRIQSEGRSFVSYPMIATQRDGYSDIVKSKVSYKSCLEDEYRKVAKKIMAHG